VNFITLSDGQNKILVNTHWIMAFYKQDNDGTRLVLVDRDILADETVEEINKLIKDSAVVNFEECAFAHLSPHDMTKWCKRKANWCACGGACGEGQRI
jgi:hypothetical protein